MHFNNPNCPLGTVPYRIMAGDTLFSIAIRFNTTVNDIIRANPGINPFNLRVGQIICVPMGSPTPGGCPPGTFAYIIRPGDTFWPCPTF